jgi:hypothetical protein
MMHISRPTTKLKLKHQEDPKESKLDTYMKLYPSSPVVTVRLSSLRGLSARSQAYRIWNIAFMNEGIPMSSEMIKGILGLKEKEYNAVLKEINRHK